MANNFQNIENPIIGIDLLKMLMLQLYSNPRCIYREYIQNALDSIDEAVKIGILPQEKDGRVSISITKNDISIEDNGTGICRDRAVKILTDIANSVKNGVDTAGQFGVGRLSGGGYCQILEFETTYKGEPVSTIVSLNTMELRKMIENKQIDISAEEAMMKICSSQTLPANEDEHWFVVRLKNVINSREVLLDIDEIKNYIAEYAPIGYSTTFDSLINGCTQSEFVKKHKQINKIRVSLNDYSDIEKGYGVTIVGTGDPIEKIRYFELPEHPKFGSLGWGWYAVTAFSVQINEEKDCCAGIRLRKHNISLDKNILNPCFKESRGNKYFYGEIFITNDNIVPDSGRQGLAASEEADALIAEIKKYFSSTLHTVYHRASKLKAALYKTEEIVEKLKNPDFTNALGALYNRLKANIEDFKKAASPDSKEEINDVIAIYQNKYDEALKSEVESFLVPHQKQDKKSNILDLLVETVQDNTDNSTPQNGLQQHSPVDYTPKHNNNLISNTHQQPLVPNKPSPQKTTSKYISRSKTVDDILSTLEGGNYTPDQIDLLKRVFSTMLVVCSSSNKKSVIQLMEIAVKSLN